MKTNFKEVIINLLALLILVYLPFAFILAEFNPLNWNVIYRSLYILVLVAILTYGYQEYRKK